MLEWGFIFREKECAQIDRRYGLRFSLQWDGGESASVRKRKEYGTISLRRVYRKWAIKFQQDDGYNDPIRKINRFAEGGKKNEAVFN